MLSLLDRKFKYIRALLYDFFILNTTSPWYREVLLECPTGTSMLDVGIGTAASLIDNRHILISKQMNVVGVDYDLDYVSRAQVNIARSDNMQYLVRVVHASVHDFNKDLSEKFDVIYFSGSFMAIRNQAEALRHCTRMLRIPIPKDRDTCNIFFTQTFERRTLVGNYITPYIKRFLSFMTTIDFGIVTYEDEFREVLERADVEIVRIKVLKSTYFRSQVIVMARPKLRGVDT
ncbi:unnamed protein product [Phytomonas sp. EM1]|nr:unnamed protein product [Phytomonas sp. EM1]|eukprot:CCW62281.1 unnamed protein product [Phytomonas sp. isolate EM1]